MIREKITSFLEKNIFFIFMALIFLSWLPAFLACFPGTFGYDVPIQAAQVYGVDGLTLNAHHPVAHTLLISGFLGLGNVLFHSYTVGYALFTVFQMLIISGISAGVFVMLLKKGCPWFVIVPGLLWIMFYPGIQILVMNGTKDVLFGALLLQFTLDYWCALQNEKPEKKEYIRVGASGILTCLLRNQGIYIVLALLLLGLILRCGKKGLHITLGAVVIFAEVFSFICTHGFHLEQGDKREMLSLPMQQMAYVSHLAIEGEVPVNVTEEQLEQVHQLIPNWDVLTEFAPKTADPVKSFFDTEELSANLGKYLKLYIQLGLQNPKMYIRETITMVDSYWNMNRNPYSNLCLEWTFPQLNEWEIAPNCLLPDYYKYLEDYANHRTPAPLTATAGVGMWLLVVIFVISIFKKNKKIFMGMMPIVLFVLTMLLGPVALLRYLFPVMLATPLLLGMIYVGIVEKRRAN